MKKLFCLIGIQILLLSVFKNTAYCQRKIKNMDADKEAANNDDKTSSAQRWQDNVSFGGNVGASFFNGGGFVLLQPTAFYKLAKNTTAGAGITYIYWQQKIPLLNGSSLTFSDNVFGLNLFARQQLFDPVFVHVEYNPMNFTRYNPLTRDEARTWVNAFYVGGGIMNRSSSGGGYYIMGLYDLLWNAEKSFYPRPIDIRLGFFF